jgi:ubiquinone biosynthesis UbiH/UbiF/VisC/COQ6 family hydroxylase
MQYDLIIIGSGPAGLSLAAALGSTNLKILILEKQNLDFIQNPQDDGREIALTHSSKDILNSLGVWELIDKNFISYIKTAKVLDESCNESLDFASDKLNDLGFLVSNYKIREALYNKVKNQDNLTILTDQEVKSIDFQDNSANIKTKDNNYSAKLVVAADSRFSTNRRQAGIGAQMKDYGKTMLVVNVKLEKNHNFEALEKFDYDKTIALLPMLDNKASFVLTVKHDIATKWQNFSDDEFSKQTTAIFNDEFGTITKAGDIFAYPLVGVFADKFYSTRFALLGDATVGMHPVTAHGFNLGLRGADILAKQIRNADNNNIDIGDNYVLKRYENKHKLVSQIMYYGTNTVLSLFASENSNKPLRKLAFSLATKATPIKKAITHHLTSVSQL